MRTALKFSAAVLGLTCISVSLLGFDFNKLSDNLDKVKRGVDKTKEVTDVVKEDGKHLAKGWVGIGPEEENLIGDSVALEIVGNYGGLLRNKAITMRVNLIGKSLAKYSSRPALPWVFGVLNSDTVNAFSAPGGRVFITKGLYDMATDDDLLAAILAHEIAHITGKHALKIIQRGEFITGATTLGSKYSKDYQRTDDLFRKFDVGIEDITNTLFEKGFDPKTEYEADRIGRELAETSGYARDGLRKVLTALEREGRDSNAVFSSHPSLSDRIDRLGK